MGAQFNNGSSLTFNTKVAKSPSLPSQQSLKAKSPSQTWIKTEKATPGNSERKRSSKGQTKTSRERTQNATQPTRAGSQASQDHSSPVAANEEQSKPLDLSTKPKRQNRKSRAKTKKNEKGVIQAAMKQPQPPPEQPQHHNAPYSSLNDAHWTTTDGVTNSNEELAEKDPSRTVIKVNVEGLDSFPTSSPPSVPVTPQPSSNIVDSTKSPPVDVVTTQLVSSPGRDFEPQSPPLISDSIRASLSHFRFGKESSCPTCEEIGVQGKLKFCFVSFEVTLFVSRIGMVVD